MTTSICAYVKERHIGLTCWFEALQCHGLLSWPMSWHISAVEKHNLKRCTLEMMTVHQTGSQPHTINKGNGPSLLSLQFLFFPKLFLSFQRKRKCAEKQLIIIIYVLEYERTSHKELSSPKIV